MTILAIDSASEYASVAIRVGGRTVSEVSVHSRDGFGHLLFDAVEKCKNEAKVELAEVDCFAAGAGPGSFTGLRVALAAVKGLAEAADKRAVAISNLRALSVCGQKDGLLRVVLLDARRADVYAAVYDSDLRLVVPETVGPVATFLDALGDVAQYEFICPASLGTTVAVPFTEAPLALASAIALVAEQDGADGRWVDPAALDANYVRRSDAELFWRDS